jgi:hypothetical protein
VIVREKLVVKTKHMMPQEPNITSDVRAETAQRATTAPQMLSCWDDCLTVAAVAELKSYATARTVR